jgi:hypothetical protein
VPCKSENSKKTTIKGKQVSGKREQANEEFLEKLHGRTTGALLQYFFSHGICVDSGLVTANEAAPRKPKLWPYAVWGSLFVAGALLAHALVAFGIVVYAIGVVKYQQFKKKREASDMRIQDADRELDQVVISEITPRNEFVLQ